jgi:hypothetical protein
MLSKLTEGRRAIGVGAVKAAAEATQARATEVLIIVVSKDKANRGLLSSNFSCDFLSSNFSESGPASLEPGQFSLYC